MDDIKTGPQNLSPQEDSELQNKLSAVPSTSIAAPMQGATSTQPLMSSADLESVFQHAQDKEKYGNQKLQTAAESLASGLTFGLSDQFLTKVLGEKPEDLRKRREINPGISATSEGAGVVLPYVLTAGAAAPIEGAAAAVEGANAIREASLAGKAANAIGETAGVAVKGVDKLGKITESAAAKVLDSVINTSGSKKIAQEIVKKSIAKGLGSAVEGAAYGTGQLLREDALGEANFNGENLLSYAGSGALLAGTLGAAIPIASSTLGSSSNVIKDLSESASSRFLNPEEDAQKLLGFTPSQVEKINAKQPTFFANLPDFVRNKLNLRITDSADSLLEKTLSLKKAAGTELDNIYTAVADKQIDRSFFNTMAGKIEAKFVEPYENLKSFKSQIGPAKNIIEDLRSQAAMEGPITAGEMRTFRQKMDELAQSFYKARDPSKGAEAAFEARNLLKDEINSFVTKVDPELGQRLQIANSNYNYTRTIEDKLVSRTLKDKNLIDFKDMIFGGVWTGAFGADGLLIPLARKVLNSDLKRKISILSGIEKSNKLITSKIETGTADFFANKSGAMKSLSTSILVKSPLSKNKDNQDAKNKLDAFNNIKEKITDLSTDPDKFGQNLGKSLYSIGRIAPNTAEAMAQTSKNALDFLAEKIPKDGSDLNLPAPFAKKYQPSSMEMAKFEKYVQIVENPLSVMDELKAGTLTRDHVEALQIVYPDVYSRIRQEVVQKLSEPDVKLTYSKKIQIGMLMDLQTDQSLIPKNLIALQQNFGTQPGSQEAPQQQGAVKPSQTGLKNLSVADRAESGSEQVINRSDS